MSSTSEVWHRLSLIANFSTCRRKSDGWCIGDTSRDLGKSEEIGDVIICVDSCKQTGVWDRRGCGSWWQKALASWCSEVSGTQRILRRNKQKRQKIGKKARRLPDLGNEEFTESVDVSKIEVALGCKDRRLSSHQGNRQKAWPNGIGNSSMHTCNLHHLFEKLKMQGEWELKEEWLFYLRSLAQTIPDCKFQHIRWLMHWRH